MTPVWTHMADFFNMGGYGLYVWGAFGVTVLLVAAEVVSIRASRRALQASGVPPSARHSA